MNPACPFCKIITGQLPATILYHDDLVTAFRDIHPVAPTHILIVPNKHIPSVSHVEPEDEPILGHLFSVARKIAELDQITAGGYRAIINTGPHSGQTIFHLHMHVIGGQPLKFPWGNPGSSTGME